MIEIKMRRPGPLVLSNVVHTVVMSFLDAVHALYSFWRSSTFAISIYLATVASVAFYDSVLTIRYAESLEYMEQNPAGRWLMGLNYLKWGEQPDLTLILTMKTLGTLIVLATMYTLFKRRTRIGHPVALGVTSFQLVLAFYLTFGLPDK
ncbi:MAG: hypothetical protein ABL921_06835 [Pirellula sp.]